MPCPKCGVENRQTARFCDGCGSPLQPRCSSCGALNRTGARFCDGCGASLAVWASPGAIIDAAPRLNDKAATDVTDGERKTVTALFADITGSTSLIERLDPEEARALIDPALKLMVDAVHQYDGYIVQSTGDGTFALCGAPVAYEDHRQRPGYAALRLQASVKSFS